MAEKNRIRLSVGQKLNRASIKNNTAIITTAAASQDDPKHIIVQGAGGLKGETGPQGPQGPQGIQGPKGDTGATGPANTLSIGTVEKGESAGATITGDAPNQTLNLTLPKGDKGDTGNAATVTAGTTTTLPAGSSASVTNSGTTSAAVFDFSIPRGDKGDTGTAATIAVGTTTTLDSGSSATVTNSGTSSAAVFNFGIPKGDAADPPEAYKTVSGNPITMADAGPSIKSINKFLGDTEQTTLSGKNLLNVNFTSGSLNGINYTNNGDGSITVSGTASANTSIPITSTPITLAANTTYTQSIVGERNGINVVPSFKDSGGNVTYNYFYNNGTKTSATTMTLNSYDLYAGAGSVVSGTFKIQLEAGSAATAYEQYCGGTASPNPDYPQTVHTVSGTQVATITDGNTTTTYNVRLGSVELCKIGTYQDYIYKSGDDWYIHKEIVKGVLDGTETWQYPSSSASYTYFQLYFTNFANKYGARFADLLNPAGAIMADKFVCITDPANAEGLSIYGSWFRITVPNSIATTKTALNNWLTNNNVTFYCWMQTPTDTQITNADLIDDLDALNEADLFDGSTTLTITATSPNLPASLNLDYWTWFKGEAGSGGGNYTAGTGLNLVGHQFSVDTTVIAEKTDIPTVNNATLTIQKNGSDVATFTANSSTNATANISVPTQTSGLTNNGADGTSTYVEADELSTVATSGSYNDLTNKPTLYPVGAVYSSTNNVSPATLVGGTWTQLNDALPEAYTQVEYLESSGTQYINIGYNANSLIEATVVASLTSGFLFGSGKAGSYVSICVMDNSGLYRGRLRNGSGSNANLDCLYVTGDGIFHTITLSSPKGLLFEGYRLATGQSYIYTESFPLYLFAWDSNNSAANFGVAKVKNFKLYDDGSLVRNLVPCRRNSDDVLGMYDTVGGQFYQNAGTGSFIAGPNTINTWVKTA